MEDDEEEYWHEENEGVNDAEFGKQDIQGTADQTISCSKGKGKDQMCRCKLNPTENKNQSK